MPSTLTPELQATIRKCLQVDRRKRMTIRQVLKDDPWLTNFGKLPCPVSSLPKTVFEETMVVDDEKENRDEKTRKQFMKDLERDSQNPNKVKRTVIYHPINPSTYYTTKAGSSQSIASSNQIQNVELLRSELLQSIRSRARRLGIKSAERWELRSPVKLLFSTLNPSHKKKDIAAVATVALIAPNRSIAEIVQRIAKDQVYHFQLTNHHVHNQSQSSRPPSLSSSSTTGSSISSSTANDSALAAIDDDNEKKSSRDVMTLLKQTCQLMGITYVQDSPASLHCILTLRSGPKKTPNSTSSTSTTGTLQNVAATPTSINLPPKHTRKQSQTSSVGTSFGGSTDDNGGGARQHKRMSLPLISHLTSSMTTSFFGRNKPRHSMDESTTITQTQPQQQMNKRKQKEGIAMFTIEIEGHKRRADKISLRFSKQQGSSTVFKMAGGWVAGVMALDGKIGR